MKTRKHSLLSTLFSSIALAALIAALPACGVPGEEEIADATVAAMSDEETKDAMAEAIADAMDDEITQSALSDAIIVAMNDQTTKDAIADAVAEAMAEQTTQDALAAAVVAAMADPETVAAIAAAVELATMRVALTETIAGAKALLAISDEGLGQGEYPTGSKAALEDEVVDAEVVDDDPDSTLEEVKDANEDLIIAVAVFSAEMFMDVFVEGLLGNIDGATVLLGFAAATNPTGAAATATDVLDDAIGSAQDVADDPNASQDDVDGADADLDDAAAGVCTALPGITGC
ncbi:hypothetical protein KAI87_06180, partial [Myxococcota bacterium]|nr:hypothetical protein [Myxococcota bacterium]